MTREKALIQRDPSEGNARVRLWALHVPPGQVQSRRLMGQAVDLLFCSLLYRLRSFQAPVNEGSSSLINGHVFLAKCICVQELGCSRNCCIRAGQDILVTVWGARRKEARS